MILKTHDIKNINICVRKKMNRIVEKYFVKSNHKRNRKSDKSCIYMSN